jgi:inner membrane protein
MDIATHTLTGLALSRAAFDRIAPRPALTLALAASAPDIDILALSGGILSYLDWHRQITHSLIAAPLLAAAVAAVVSWRKAFWRTWLAALAGVLSHLLLDWGNVYGVRLWLPFSSEWQQLGALPLVDPWMWLLLSIAFLPPAISRLVSAEIGARRTSGRGWAVAALALLALYGAGRTILHSRAVAILESRIYGGEGRLVRILALPDPVNPTRWRGAVETPSLWWTGTVDLTAEFDPGEGRITHKPDAATWESASRAAALVKFRRFAQAPVWTAVPWDTPERSVRVELGDLRFGGPPPERLIVWALLDERGALLDEGVRWHGRPSR